MKKFLFCLLVLFVCTGIGMADEPFRQARYDGFKVLQPAEGSIVMIGNSITDMHIWNEVFRDKDGKCLPISNRGNSGSYATQQSENLESYLGNKPAKVFMMIGTNDIATSGGLNTPATRMYCSGLFKILLPVFIRVTRKLRFTCILLSTIPQATVSRRRGLPITNCLKPGLGICVLQVIHG